MHSPDPYWQTQQAGIDHLISIAIEQAEADGPPTLELPAPPECADQLARLSAEISRDGIRPRRRRRK